MEITIYVTGGGLLVALLIAWALAWFFETRVAAFLVGAFVAYLAVAALVRGIERSSAGFIIFGASLALAAVMFFWYHIREARRAGAEKRPRAAPP